MATEISQGIQDVQAYADRRGVALKAVGIKGFTFPLKLARADGTSQQVSAKALMGVYLAPELKGTHMSRFIIQLGEWSAAGAQRLCGRALLEENLQRMGSDSSYLDLAFTYFIQKKAPVTDFYGPLPVDCVLQAVVQQQGDLLRCQQILGLKIPIATLCPCSKEISDYGAHNQRADLRVRLLLEDAPVWIEELVPQLEECASCPVYPILKRLDEKYVTERQYDNPKFVEDVVRDATLLLRDYPGVRGFSIEVEALESIHAHNAWTYHEENFADFTGWCSPWSV